MMAMLAWAIFFFLVAKSESIAAPSIWITPSINTVTGPGNLSETLSEAHTVNTLLGSVRINNEPSNYDIISQTYAGMFNVTYDSANRNGDIYLINGTFLDYETDVTLTVVINGSNSAGYGVATITINVGDVNDNPPTFTADSFSVTISSTISNDFVIYTVMASDVDSSTNNDISYSIVAGDDPPNKFSITPRSGIVKRTGETFNSSVYSLTINATDGTFYSTASLLICIDCKNGVPGKSMMFNYLSSILMTSLLHVLWKAIYYL